jgi:hypothetical protein
LLKLIEICQGAHELYAIVFQGDVSGILILYKGRLRKASLGALFSLPVNIFLAVCDNDGEMGVN